MKLITDASDVKQLQAALHEAQVLAFELLTCVMEGEKPPMKMMNDYGALMANATAAMAAPVEPMTVEPDKGDGHLACIRGKMGAPDAPERIGPFSVSDGVYEHMGDEYKGGVWLYTAQIDAEQAMERAEFMKRACHEAQDLAAQAQDNLAAMKKRYELLCNAVANGVDLFKGAPDGGEISCADARALVDARLSRWLAGAE